MSVGLDVAASEFYTAERRYDLAFKSTVSARSMLSTRRTNAAAAWAQDAKKEGDVLSAEALGELYRTLARQYPIVSIEDPFDQVCLVAVVTAAAVAGATVAAVAVAYAAIATVAAAATAAAAVVVAIMASLTKPRRQDDWRAFSNLTSKIGSGVQIVGDDLLVRLPHLFASRSERRSHALRVR